MEYQKLKAAFTANQDSKRAQQMAAYMRGQFAFYGYQSGPRKAVYHQQLLAEKRTGRIDWDLLNKCWQDPHRELQYFVCDYLITMRKFLRYGDMPRVEHFVRTKQWWDTIDSLIKPIGYLGLNDPRVGQLMLTWSKDPDIWVRRVAIEHQLLRKKQVDTKLLQAILENNLGSQEFFINKAIGWALRDYSKTNPAWVRAFICDHKRGLSSLSIREGSKYLNR